MNITQKPNLKPYRDIDPHEVVNLYSHVDASANKGSLVTITEAEGNTNVWQNANSPATPHLDVFGPLANTPSRAYSNRYEVTWKIKNAFDEDIPLGLTLYDVRELNAYGEKLIHRPRYERFENDYVVSGEAVPVLVRGFVKINGFNGDPGPGSGAVPSATNSGFVDVTNDPTGATNVGKFLSTPDADGYAHFKLEL